MVKNSGALRVLHTGPGFSLHGPAHMFDFLSPETIYVDYLCTRCIRAVFSRFQAVAGRRVQPAARTLVATAMDRRRTAFVTVTACALSLVTVAVGHDILAIFPFSGKSHFHMFRSIADALVDRGHNVTVVGHFPGTSGPRQSDAAPGGGPAAGTYTDYSLAGSMPVFENYTIDEMLDFGHLEQSLIILQDGLDNCEKVMSSGRLDRLVRSRAKFDLVIVEVSARVYGLKTNTKLAETRGHFEKHGFRPSPYPD